MLDINDLKGIDFNLKNESSEKGSSCQDGIGKKGYSSGLTEQTKAKIAEHERIAQEYPNSKRRLQVYFGALEMADLAKFLAYNKISGSEFARQMVLAGMKAFKKKTKPRKQTTEKFVQSQMFGGEDDK